MRYAFLFIVAAAAWAQQLDLSSLDKLASKAKEQANVNLDADKIRLTSKFFHAQGTADDPARAVISSLKGVFVRVMEFEKAGEYSQADLDPIRNQLRGPNWSKIIDVRERAESAEIWFYSEGGKMGGLTVIAAEPTELAVVNILGPIDINALAKLGGAFGIPNISGEILQRKQTGGAKKD